MPGSLAWIQLSAPLTPETPEPPGRVTPSGSMIMERPACCHSAQSEVGATMSSATLNPKGRPTRRRWWSFPDPPSRPCRRRSGRRPGWGRPGGARVGGPRIRSAGVGGGDGQGRAELVVGEVALREPLDVVDPGQQRVGAGRGGPQSVGADGPAIGKQGLLRAGGYRGAVVVRPGLGSPIDLEEHAHHDSRRRRRTADVGHGRLKPDVGPGDGIGWNGGDVGHDHIG